MFFDAHPGNNRTVCPTVNFESPSLDTALPVPIKTSGPNVSLCDVILLLFNHILPQFYYPPGPLHRNYPKAQKQVFQVKASEARLWQKSVLGETNEGERQGCPWTILMAF